MSYRETFTIDEVLIQYQTVLKHRDELQKRLRYAYDNLKYPDTIEGNTESDKTRIALGIPLDAPKFRDWEPEQAYGTHHDLREHLRHGGTREDY